MRTRLGGLMQKGTSGEMYAPTRRAKRGLWAKWKRSGTFFYLTKLRLATLQQPRELALAFQRQREMVARLFREPQPEPVVAPEPPVSPDITREAALGRVRARLAVRRRTAAEQAQKLRLRKGKGLGQRPKPTSRVEAEEYLPRVDGYEDRKHRTLEQRYPRRPTEEDPAEAPSIESHQDPLSRTQPSDTLELEEDEYLEKAEPIPIASRPIALRIGGSSRNVKEKYMAKMQIRTAQQQGKAYNRHRMIRIDDIVEFDQATEGRVWDESNNVFIRPVEEARWWALRAEMMEGRRNVIYWVDAASRSDQSTGLAVVYKPIVSRFFRNDKPQLRGKEWTILGYEILRHLSPEEAELSAINIALMHVLKRIKDMVANKRSPKGHNATIYSDSRYCLERIQYFRSTPQDENDALLNQLAGHAIGLANTICKYGANVQLHWVTAGKSVPYSQRIPGNFLADLVATGGRKALVFGSTPVRSEPPVGTSLAPSSKDRTSIARKGPRAKGRVRSREIIRKVTGSSSVKQ